jgi:hypothetical protein
LEKAAAPLSPVVFITYMVRAKGVFLMRLTINIDCTPQEARAFFGMPDVEPLNEMVVAEMIRRAKEQMDTLADPERLVARWMEMSGKGMDALHGLFGAMAAPAPGSKKK